MAFELYRPVGYTGSLQNLVVPENYGSGQFTAWLWGAGGGGGAGDASVYGGNGGGGGYSVVTVPIAPGDVISIAVGQGGKCGRTGSGIGGGAGGASYDDGTTSYSGAQGGNSGNSGSSGSGGGSGGATVLFLNGSVVAVAGGGGGGGGGARFGANRPNANAPGIAGNADAGIYNGQRGANFYGDGGGAGAGGGGYTGGQGGKTNGYEITGDAGGNGGNLGDTILSPSGTTPGGASTYNYQYYAGSSGRGGTDSVNGTNGFGLFLFNLVGTYVNVSGTYTPVLRPWIHYADAWQEVKSTYIRQNGVWKTVQGGTPPAFNNVPGNFGVNGRPYG